MDFVVIPTDKTQLLRVPSLIQSDLWFEDGNVILIATGGVGFKVSANIYVILRSDAKF